MHGVQGRFVELRMAAAGIGPNAGPGDLAEAALLEQRTPRAVEQEDGKSPVQRGGGVMNVDLLRNANGPVGVIDENHMLEGRLRQIHAHIKLADCRSGGYGTIEQPCPEPIPEQFA